jgi:hypothetical protein
MAMRRINSNAFSEYVLDPIQSILFISNILQRLPSIQHFPRLQS